ncbi:MAG: tRNA (N6-threonylcarbamoyladenosine(37)-N6)-methyltransferase TrmO [Zestosphaera sp.]
MEIILRPVGVVRIQYADEEVRNSDDGVPGVIEVYDEFKGGLDGIEGFSHLIVIAYLHKVSEEQKKVLRVRPRRLLKHGFRLDELPEVGVFCTDSPHRPSPIALTVVRLIKRESRLLYVENLDLFDGTPVLDIKPYTPGRCVEAGELKLPEWLSRLYEEIRVRGGGRKPKV